MPALPFPASSTPGPLTGTGEGRLINAYSEKLGDTDEIRRTPGLALPATFANAGARGFADVNGLVYAARNGVVEKANGATVSTLTGSLPGTSPVTMARNNRVTAGVSTPDLAIVDAAGAAYWVDVNANTVAAWPDADLPAPNSVTPLGGYFIFTIADGRMFGSGLNATSIDPLAFATAEAKPDGLVRGIAVGQTFYAMGSQSIEPWLNAGLSPWPLSRQGAGVIPIGLLTTMAVAGTEDGWGGDPIFVASDGTVRRLAGYDAQKISTPAVERFIAGSTVSTIEAMVYVVKGRQMWAVSSDAGTWEYCVNTGRWNERVSRNTTPARWRASRSVNSGGRWLTGDILSNGLLAVDDTIRTEVGQVVDWTVESGPLKGYPARVAPAALFADVTQATGASVALSYSVDGGSTWISRDARALDNANLHPLRWNGLAMTTHHGLRVRLTSSSTQDFACMGASVPDIEARKP